ncbi:MAG: ribosome biogenesis GTPase Der [Bacillota bacterium]|uniref:GTPase Der n=1 Tax=Candidatus Gallimonas intestinavium TaxID=2838603 RepID=A0A9D2JZB1_9FIRM|nr:MAG: ribosome biogenesis GTPase Der [Bacillota bacterium]HIZ72831.1 ribosome biogenesis GTPase Der [Candidatus Gallimonas intestinavium]
MQHLIAIVGRPNVGKSTFFNKVIGRKLSITENRPGVTRDRIYASAEWRGKTFTLVDTGGIELKSEDVMWKQIATQAKLAVETADVILFFVDGREGLTSSDYDVADYLRRSRKPVVLVVNKLDDYSEDKLFEFYSLGLGEPFGISAEHSRGIGDVLDQAVGSFSEGEEETGDALRIAVVGKPNAGKSSLVNRILGEERTIVTDIAGTTRDAIDSPFERDGEKYVIIDTAGIRRKRSVEDNVEYYSVLRAFDAVRRADVAVLVVDATEGLTEQDVRIIGMVHEEGKPSVIVMNKWDLVEKDTHTIETFEAKLKEDLKFMDYFKSVYISAKTGQRAEKVIKLAREAYDHAHFRIPTGALNDLLMDAMRISEPPSYQGRRLKLYYASQVSVAPPLFVLMVNDETLLHFSYARYLENVIRQAYDFSGTPIRIQVRNKKDD